MKIFIDIESEKTFIDSKMSRKFNFKVVRKAKLPIYASGSKPKKSVSRNRVKVNLRNIYDSQKIIPVEDIGTCISETVIQTLVK